MRKTTFAILIMVCVLALTRRSIKAGVDGMLIEPVLEVAEAEPLPPASADESASDPVPLPPIRPATPPATAPAPSWPYYEKLLSRYQDPAHRDEVLERLLRLESELPDDDRPKV